MSDVKATVDDKYIYLKTPYKFKDICKSIEGRRWDKKKKMWKYPTSPFLAEEIRAKFFQADPTLDFESDEEFDNLVRKSIDIKGSQNVKEKSEEDLEPVPITKLPAWEHQLQAYNFAKELPSAMLAMDMGTGKTKVTIDLIVNRGHKKTLIVCPSSVVDVWPDEFKKHAGEPVNVVPLREGSVKERKRKAELEMKKSAAHDEPVALVINYEAVWRDPFATWAKKQNFDLIVADEIHRIKAPGGKQSRFCYQLGKSVPYKIGLTGTPMPHSPLDIYAQYRFLDPGVFGTSYNRFKNRYAIMGGFKNYQVKGYQNKDELYNKFDMIAYSCDSEDVQDLPEKVFLRKTTRLSNKAMKHYIELEKAFYTEIDGNEITALNVLTKLLRLQQITGGYLPDDEGNVHKIDDSKKKLFADVIEDIGQDEPLVVFARFHNDLDEIAKACENNGRTWCELSGRINQLKEFQDGKFDVIIVQIKSGGVGVDLTRARYCIYYSVGHSLGDYMQSLKRVHRPGQDKRTYFIHLVVENTVDVKVEKSLINKEEIIDMILKKGDKND